MQTLAFSGSGVGQGSEPDLILDPDLILSTFKHISFNLPTTLWSKISPVRKQAELYDFAVTKPASVQVSLAPKLVPFWLYHAAFPRG